MENETTTTEAPRKRGRPPGKKMAAVADKPKAARGRPAREANDADVAKAKSKPASKGIRYDADRQREIVAFIQAQGRGGISKAKAKFGVSFPTLARWVKEAGSGNGSSKSKSESKKAGRPKKSETASTGHVLISKKVLKEFRKGLATLETAFGFFSNALRVLE